MTLSTLVDWLLWETKEHDQLEWLDRVSWKACQMLYTILRDSVQHCEQSNMQASKKPRLSWCYYWYTLLARCSTGETGDIGETAGLIEWLITCGATNGEGGTTKLFTLDINVRFLVFWLLDWLFASLAIWSITWLLDRLFVNASVTLIEPARSWNVA